MNNRFNTVAFDLGGVLAYQDLSLLSDEELFLFEIFMKRRNIKDLELLRYANSRILDIYLKIHKLNIEAISTLEMLNDMKIKISIWTNNIKEIENWFEIVNLYRYISRENVINSFYLGVDKPDIEFYKRALHILKNNPNEVLFFDDSSKNIIEAKNIGIFARRYDFSENLRKNVYDEIRRIGK